MTFKFEPTILSEIMPLLEEVQNTQTFVWRRDDVGIDGTISPNFLSELLTEFNAQCFALYQSEPSNIAGFISLFPSDEEDTASIGPLYIRPPYRGRGLGRQLMDDIIQWAHAQDIKTLNVHTWGENTRARHIFEQAGFVFIAEVPNARVNGDSTVQYRLEIM